MMANVQVMAHMVAGYPTDELAKSVAKGLADGGVSYVEIQLPFSDPSADGPLIQHACATVLDRNYTVAQGFSFVTYVRENFPGIPVFLMSYANLAYRRGVGRFVRDAADAGVSGLIIPDLPFDHDEGLRESCGHAGIHAVPVAAPSMSPERKETLRGSGYPFVYAALRAGITGSETVIDRHNLDFLDSIRGDSKVLGGFGIRHGSQVRALAPHVHAVVAGSVFVDIISRYAGQDGEGLELAIKEKARELVGM